ncbi:hypothetical protein [Corynebacterium pacaense]|uniref:hypothetical protein n=1 Tax=Corynebacterium pacaense TaxID=1816684 RepID=UPI0009B98AD0|nr:hypothetical protein [Corynebacterium pacaense]
MSQRIRFTDERGVARTFRVRRDFDDRTRLVINSPPFMNIDAATAVALANAIADELEAGR